MATRPPKFPEGKFMATVKVGERGQIVIPKGARDLFGIEPGDTLLLLADVDQGIALVQYDPFDSFGNIMGGMARGDAPEKEDT